MWNGKREVRRFVLVEKDKVALYVQNQKLTTIQGNKVTKVYDTKRVAEWEVYWPGANAQEIIDEVMATEVEE